MTPMRRRPKRAPKDRAAGRLMQAARHDTATNFRYNLSPVTLKELIEIGAIIRRSRHEASLLPDMMKNTSWRGIYSAPL